LIVAGSRRADEHVNDYQTIRYQRHQDIGTLTLARPGKRNAQNPLMWQELARLGAELVPDQTLRCLVVTGDGPTFSAGIDLVEGMAGMLADMAGRLGDESTRAVGQTAAGTFSWIPDLGCASVAAGDLDAAAAGLAGRLAAQPPLAVRGARRALDAAWYSSPEESLKVAVEQQISCLASEDFKEGAQALAEGRSPQWRGR
jgi:enoyl-CoA hydratase/carnithine racemase